MIAVYARTRGKFRVLASSFDGAERGACTLRIVAGPRAFRAE